MVRLTLTKGDLLKQAVSPLIKYRAKNAIIRFSPEGLSLIASDSNHFVIAVLRIHYSRFNYYHCDEDITAGVDPTQLAAILGLADDEDSLTINDDVQDGEVGIDLVCDNARTHLMKYGRMALMEVRDHFLANIELQYEYEVVIGIPTRIFIDIILHMEDFADIVVLTVTDTLVNFSAGNEEVVLDIERGECIIGGAQADEVIYMLLRLEHAHSFVFASVMSDAVWIFQSTGAPSLLNCPVRILGCNIMFYFL